MTHAHRHHCLLEMKYSSPGRRYCVPLLWIVHVYTNELCHKTGQTVIDDVVISLRFIQSHFAPFNAEVKLHKCFVDDQAQ